MPPDDAGAFGGDSSTTSPSSSPSRTSTYLSFDAPSVTGRATSPVRVRTYTVGLPPTIVTAGDGTNSADASSSMRISTRADMPGRSVAGGFSSRTSVAYSLRSGFCHRFAELGSVPIRSTLPANGLSGNASTVTVAVWPVFTFASADSWTLMRTPRAFGSGIERMGCRSRIVAPGWIGLSSLIHPPRSSLDA
ncbi:MAG: hypothetical protein U1E39_03745 [Planctomycetota bacterium]